MNNLEHHINEAKDVSVWNDGNIRSSVFYDKLKTPTDEVKEIYDSLDKGDTVEVVTRAGNNEYRTRTLKVTKGKTLVGKRKVERITLVNVDNLKGVKWYFYNRDGSISVAIGDMGTVLMTIVKK